MIFDNPIFSTWLLPFLLVFVVVFAVLHRSKLFGEPADAKQVNIMIALAIGLITVLFPGPRDMMVKIMPWLGVGLAVLLLFFILYGFVAGDLTSMPTGMKVTFGILAGLFTLGVILYATGLGNWIWDYFGVGTGSDLLINVLVIAAIIGVVFLAVFGGGSGKPSRPAGSTG